MLSVRPYRPSDYDAVKALYLQPDLYGGQFDPARDAPDKLDAVTRADPQSILVCETYDQVIGTLSLIENGRVAWLFRFAVAHTPFEDEATTLLHRTACDILAARGHTEVLVYTPVGNTALDRRYHHLGLTQGGAYTCFWQSLVGSSAAD